MSDWMIEVERVEKRFGPVRALAGVDLVTERGKVLALLGPNGAGNPVTELGHSLLRCGHSPRHRSAPSATCYARLRRLRALTVSRPA